MQLTWSKSKPALPVALTTAEHTDTDSLFHLDPWSYQASSQMSRRRNNCCSQLPKPKRFRFVTEQAPVEKQKSEGLYKSQKINIALNNVGESERQERTPAQQSSSTVNEGTLQFALGSHLMDTYLNDGLHSQYSGIEQCDIDLDEMMFMSDFSIEPLGWLNSPSTGTMDSQIAGAPVEPSNGYSMIAMSSTTSNTGEGHSLPISATDNPKLDMLVVGSPLLHKTLFEKSETLLNLCK